MSTLLWLVGWIGGVGALAYHRVALRQSTIAIFCGLLVTTIFSSLAWYSLLLLWAAFMGVALVLNNNELRRKLVLNPILEIFQKSIPPMSQTEQQALEAGTVGWDGELFSGKPNWNNLLSVPAPQLTEEEQAFIDGPVTQLCEMVNDWDITHYDLDLPPEAWQFIKDQGFFGLIIPKKFGGKGFSAYAHAVIIGILSGRSYTLSTIVSVPNSLGPAELLHLYGTEQQKNHYLPRLAKGQEIPCFALTGPTAGSDAGAIPDKGVITKGTFQGQEILGINLNWDKRYITLAPVATLLGLAFKLYDPEHLLGEEEELGITCALIPTDLPGITIGNRHYPINIPFQNGPTQGKNVFIPLEYIIGGPSMAGKGWKMLMECLATGRAISLPATSTGGAKIGMLTSGAYSFIRRQFNTSICNFEGIQEALSRIAGFTYIAESARLFTANSVDQGEKPAVPGAICKCHITELGRQIANNAMDIHGGKGIMMGPNNYLARSYEGAPIAITVEGANILTRSMIIFGQGSVRCHPYILAEMNAVKEEDFETFEDLFGEHVKYTLSNIAKAFFHGITFAKFALSPSKKSDAKYYRELTRACSAFALVADACMISLGGKLKFKESLSARLGDLLSMMYLASTVLKNYADDNRPEEDFPIVEWALNYCLSQYWLALDSLLRNLPNRMLSIALRVTVMPFGRGVKPPKDSLNKPIMKLMTTDNEARDRLLENVFISANEADPVNLVVRAFQANLEIIPLREKLDKAIKNKEIKPGSTRTCIAQALKAKIFTPEEANDFIRAEILAEQVIAVDDFAPDELVNNTKTEAKSSSKTTPSKVSNIVR